MAIIEHHQGCGGAAGCMGPANDFYSVFGTPLWELTKHICASIIIGVVLFAALFFLNEKKKIKLQLYQQIIISVITAVLMFFLLAYLFPVLIVF